MYELILIDADGTLFDYDRAEKYALVKSLNYFGFKKEISHILQRYRDINISLWLELEQGKISKTQLRTQRFIQLFKEFKLELQVEDFSEYYLKKLAEGSFLIDGAEDVCRYMSEKYKVVIVTNGMKEVQLSRLKKSEIEKYIDYIVISEEVGVNKPDKYIFEWTLDKVSHINKKSVIMIGDSLSSDIAGGLRYGIDTCWLNMKKLNNTKKIKPKYEISELKGLYEIL